MVVWMAHYEASLLMELYENIIISEDLQILVNIKISIDILILVVLLRPYILNLTRYSYICCL